MPRLLDADAWVPLSDPTGTPSATARRNVALDNTDELYRTFAPGLRRAMDFTKMRPWQRRLMRPNWGALSNGFFGAACVCFLVASWPPLGAADSVLGLQLSGSRLQDAANLTGCLLFVIEPVFDFLAVWVECWDDILWTAKEEQQNPRWPDWSASSAAGAAASPHGSGCWGDTQRGSLSTASTHATGARLAGGQVWALMIRKWHFWGACLFEIGSLCYCWWALAPHVYTEEQQCFSCRTDLWHGEISFECVNETGAVKHDGPAGFCNASYIGALVFVLNAVISLVGWRAYRHEVTEMIGFERQLLPGKCSSDGGSAGARRCCCRGCSTIDWLGLAGIIFLAGAALDLVDEFVDDPSAQSWIGFIAAVCWAVDVVLYCVDQHQMDIHSEPRELPEIKAPAATVVARADAQLQVEWVLDRDERTGGTSRRRSKAIWIPEYSAGKERERMHMTANW